jgi:hypothetical protein
MLPRITCARKCSKDCRGNARKHRVDNDHDNQDVLADHGCGVGAFSREVAHVNIANQGDETQHEQREERAEDHIVYIVRVTHALWGADAQ